MFFFKKEQIVVTNGESVVRRGFQRLRGKSRNRREQTSRSDKGCTSCLLLRPGGSGLHHSAGGSCLQLKTLTAESAIISVKVIQREEKNLLLKIWRIAGQGISGF